MNIVASRVRRDEADLHARGPALTSAWHRRIVAGSILCMVVVGVTPASSVPALLATAAGVLGLFLVLFAIPVTIAITAVAVAAVILALWTSSRYFALVKRNSIQSIGAIKRFSSRPQSIYDPETGFCTFSYFLLRLDEELARSERSGASFSLLLIEPSLGKSERLHQALFLTLEQAFRTADLIGRLSDDTFAVLLVDSGQDGTKTVVERLAAELGRNVSIRPAVYPDDGTDRRSLMAKIGADSGVAFPEADAVWTPDGESPFDRRSSGDRQQAS